MKFTIGGKNRLVALGLAAFLALLPCLRAPAASMSGVEGGFRWSFSTTPAVASMGDGLVAELRVEGLSGAELGEFALSPGLSLGASLVRPYAETRDGVARSGTLVRLELLVGREGPWLVKVVGLSGREGRLLVENLAVDVSLPGGASQATWRWKAPSEVWRHQSFGVSIEGPAGARAKAAAIFQSPAGAAMETEAGRSLSWTVTALEAGTLVLPAATIDSGSAAGRVPPSSIRVRPLPAGVEESRAIGSFAVQTTGPGLDSPHAGDPLVFRLVVTGNGNLPSLRFPPWRASLDGKPLPSEDFTVRRYDQVRAVDGSYEGSSTLEIAGSCPAGRLSLEFGALAVLDPAGSISRTAVGPICVDIARAVSALASKADPFAPVLTRSAALLDAEGATAEDKAIASAAGKGKASAALALLEARRGASRRWPADLELLEAALLWQTGAKGEALALAYGLSRRSPTDRNLAALASSVSNLVGAGPRMLDSLPPPPLFLGACAVLLCLALALGLFSVRQKRPLESGRASLPDRRARRRREGLGSVRLHSPGLAAAACLCLFGALAAGGLGLASRLERNAVFAVAWTDRGYDVPSPLSENSVALQRGQCGRLVGKAEGYVCLRFQDGSVAWLPAKGVYFY